MEIFIAMAFVAGLGILCGIILVLAAKFLHVAEDERFPIVRAALPGANCGACGFAGCDGYAKALLEDENLKCNLCVPGADATSKELSEILGRKYEDVVEMVAIVKCNGNCKATKQRFEYKGVKNCNGANMFYGGSGACNYGCIGIGDCVRACPQGAICIDSGVARVDPRACIGCGLCTKVCPHNLIELVPDVKKVIPLCNSHDKGAVTRKFCTNGCIACGKCQKGCPNGAITLENNLVTIDYDKCSGCGTCADVCPVHCILKTDITGANKNKKI